MIMRLCHRMINIALTMTFSLISLTLEMKVSIPSPTTVNVVSFHQLSHYSGDRSGLRTCWPQISLQFTIQTRDYSVGVDSLLLPLTFEYTDHC